MSGDPNFVLGIVVVVVASVGAAVALEAALRARIWTPVVCAVGAVLVAIGTVGARAFPDPAAVAAEGAGVAAGDLPGPWSAGVAVPGVDLHLTPVALVGVLLVCAGVSVILFFDPVGTRGRPPATRPLEADDSL